MKPPMSLSWPTRRKLVYFVLLVIPSLLFGGYLLWEFRQPPTCFDDTKNQGELGVDCGGPCERVCQAQTQSAGALWARSFAVSGSIYNTLAYIQNPNVNLTAKNIPYEITLYGGPEDERVIAQREGSVTLPPRAVYAVFEPSIDTGGESVSRTGFRFREDPFWERANTDRPVPQITQKTRSRMDTNPRVDVVVRNPSLDRMENIQLVVILYDDQGNAIHTSRTVVAELSAEGRRNAIFTWPDSFERSVAEIEVIPVSYTVVD